MIDFAYPVHLFLLGALGVVAVLFLLDRDARRRKLRRFGREAYIAHLMPDASRYKPTIKLVLQLLALAALAIILARPRFGEKENNQTTIAGIEVMIAFDVSNSMLASSTDKPNGVSRLNRARILLEKLVDRLDNDKVGLIVFAGEAKTQMPITVDYYTAKMYLGELSPDLITFQGTAINDAINMAVNSFTPDEKTHKAIILITDAEDHEGDAIEAVKEAAKKGIQVDVIGVGTSKGAPIPVGDSNGAYMRDDEGKPVMTAFNESIAKEIAKEGNGIYVNGASSNALDLLMKQLGDLKKSEFKRVEYKASAEQFPTFAWIAIIVLIIDIFMLDRKIGWLKNINFFSNSIAKKTSQPDTSNKTGKTDIKA